MSPGAQMLFINHLPSTSFVPRAFRDRPSVPTISPGSGLRCVLPFPCWLLPLCALSVLGLQCLF